MTCGAFSAGGRLWWTDSDPDPAMDASADPARGPGLPRQPTFVTSPYAVFVWGGADDHDNLAEGYLHRSDSERALPGLGVGLVGQEKRQLTPLGR